MLNILQEYESLLMNRYICVISEKVKEGNASDGMFQRIARVDEFLLDFAPVLHINPNIKYFGRAVRSQGEYKVNPFLHFFLIFRILSGAKVIYIHSILNGFSLLQYLIPFRNKIILDLHGIVPEEFEARGMILHSRIFALFEYALLLCSRIKIFVTFNMQVHFSKKYSRDFSENSIILPIFSSLESPQLDITAKSDENVIYAGGLQEWQNYDMMRKAIDLRKSDYKFEFYTSSENVSRVISDIPFAEVSTLSNIELLERMRRASMGFLLRDDSIVNRVAYPTKLAEYLDSGVIPILIQPAIGDLEFWEYQYVLYEDFIGDLITAEDISKKIKNNLAIRLKEKEFLADSIRKMRETVGDLL